MFSFLAERNDRQAQIEHAAEQNIVVGQCGVDGHWLEDAKGRIQESAGCWLDRLEWKAAIAAYVDGFNTRGIGSP